MKSNLNSLKNAERRYLVVGLFSLLLIWFVRFSLEPTLIEIEAPHFLLMHTLLEAFSIFVAISIFFQAVITYSPSAKNSNFFLGLVFLAVGSFDMFHTLFYKGMPFLDDEFAVSRATWFWVLGRLTEAIGVCLAVIFSRKLSIIRCKCSVGIVLLAISLIAPIVIFGHERLPVLIDPSTGLTALKIRLEYLICSIMILTLFVLMRRYKKRPTVYVLHLIMGVFLIFVGELFFTLYSRVFDIENLIGHLYKFAGYAFLFKAIFFPHIQQIILSKEKAESKRKEAEQMLFEAEKDLSRLVLRAHEEERKRVSRELHDGIGQSLYSILMTLNVASSEISASNQTKCLDEAKKMTSNAMNEVKDIAHSLRPSSLDDLGFLPALNTYVAQYKKTYSIEVNLNVVGDQKRLDSEVETALYRICQESLMNVAKYARASIIDVTIDNSEQEIVLTVHDNGIGFAIDDYLKSDGRKGIGLFSMNERAELLGGSFYIDTAINKGTTITVRIPNVHNKKDSNH